jgi:hypothetical protein
LESKIFPKGENKNTPQYFCTFSLIFVSKFKKMGQQFTQILPSSMPSFMNCLDLLFFRENSVFFVYAPALDLTGYGATETEAQHSFVQTLEAFLDFTQKKETLEGELKRLGWRKKPASKTLQPPFLDEMLKRNPYLSEIVREYDFQKSNFKFVIA